jgi:N-glycosidase YbiA
MQTIDSFSGEFRFLSNFYPSPIVWRLSRRVPPITFDCVERGFVWAKTLDPVVRRRILTADATPGQIKRLGRMLELRPDWDAIKVDVMSELVFEKFHQNRDLRDKLLDTGNAMLIEGNHWGDQFWGVCDGHGDNHLGKILMFTREILNDRE